MQPCDGWDWRRGARFGCLAALCLLLTTCAPVTPSPTGTNVVYAWTFGDGGKATTRIANHVYAKAGTFTATVTASNDVGSKSASTTVVVLDPTPTGEPEDEIFLPWAVRRLD